MIDNPNNIVIGRLIGELTGTDGPILPSAEARVTRNAVPVATGDALLPGLTGIGEYRIDVHDDATDMAMFAGQLWFGEEAAICAIRIALRDGVVTECEIIRGPPRFPGETGVDARNLGKVRPAFAEEVPPERRLSRRDIVAIAEKYYMSVELSQPGLAPLERAGARIEQGTQITGNPDFRFEFYRGLDGQDLPNFGEWSAQEQFVRGMWNADRALDVRFAVVEPRLGVACAYMTYRPWGKRFEVEIEGAGRVGPIDDSGRKVSLNAMEVFKVDHGQILEMETVWSMEAEDFRNPWYAEPTL